MLLKKSLLSLCLLSLSLTAESYYSMYGTTGFKNVIGLSNYDDDYFLVYNSVSSWSVKNNMLIFIPKGTKNYSAGFNIVGSYGFFSAYMSFGKDPNVNENIEGKFPYEYHSNYDYLVAGNTVSLINKAGLNISSKGMSEEIEYDKSGWIRLQFIPATNSFRGDPEKIIPDTGSSNLSVPPTDSTTSMPTVSVSISLDYTITYTLDKNYIDNLVEGMEVPSHCEGKVDGQGKSIEKLCTYIDSLNTDKTNLPSNYVLRDGDPIGGLNKTKEPITTTVTENNCSKIGDVNINDSGWSAIGSLITSDKINLTKECNLKYNFWTFKNSDRSWEKNTTSIKRGQIIWLKK